MIRGSARLGGLARQNIRSFHWQKLVGPYTSDEFRTFCETTSKEINAKKQVAGSISKTVPTIDWDHWDNEIKSPGVVDALKQEYENIVFADASAEGFAPLKAENLHQVAVAEAQMSAVAKSEVKEADRVLSVLKDMKNDGFNWSADQWCDKLPGMEDSLKESFEAEDYLPSDAEEKIAGLDFGELSKDFAAGSLEGEPTADIGDLNLQEEQDVISAGEWSVGRLYTNRDGRATLLNNIKKLQAEAAKV